jgi:hypothetical protein
MINKNLRPLDFLAESAIEVPLLPAQVLVERIFSCSLSLLLFGETPASTSPAFDLLAFFFNIAEPFFLFSPQRSKLVKIIQRFYLRHSYKKKDSCEVTYGVTPMTMPLSCIFRAANYERLLNFLECLNISHFDFIIFCEEAYCGTSLII